MLKMLLVIGVVLVVAAVGIFVYALVTQPDTFRVARSARINAPAEKIAGILTDLRRGAEWSPYEKKDPGMKKAFSGPASGPGARMEWDGNKEIGAGSLTVAKASPSSITLNLDMARPMKASNVVEYTLQPKGNATDMTWSIHGPMNMVSKVMCLFMDMDKMIGRDFEQGLRDLKAVAEK